MTLRLDTLIRAFLVVFCVTQTLGVFTASASSICDGLNTQPAQPTAQSLYSQGSTLASTPQVPNQFKVTGCWGNSLFSDREACQRKDVYGNLNGKFGSCATFSSFSAAIAIANKVGVTLPDDLTYKPENVARIYDTYGNPWDTVNPGSGSFKVIISEILDEMTKKSVGITPAQKKEILTYQKRIHYYGIVASEWGDIEAPSTRKLLDAVARHFNSASANIKILPLELILDGWVLDHSPNTYCPVRSNGVCDSENEEDGSDFRSAHSALLVGRRLHAGRCEIQIRNSWHGTCRHGIYGNTGRECDRENESLWIDQRELVDGISAVRIFD